MVAFGIYIKILRRDCGQISKQFFTIIFYN